MTPQAAGAFVRHLFTEHGRMVVGLCRLLLRDADEAEDAAQQVFLSAHQAVLRGSVPRDAAAWLAAIARNECRARIRLRMREPLALPELPSDLPDPLVAAIRAADLQAVWAALEALPRRQRKALVLRELGGLSYHELGRALGVSHSAVESLLFRARQQVRSLVACLHTAVPFALRDQLGGLIPGFDSGSAGAVARVAALPVALKLAGAAVGVGVLAGGAGEVHKQTAAPRLQREHSAVVSRPSAPAVRVRHVRTIVVSNEEPETRHERRHRRRGGEGREEHGAEPAREAERGGGPGPSNVQMTTTSSEGAGDARGTELEVEMDDDHSGPDGSGSDNSGPGGGGGSGSGHSGPG